MKLTGITLIALLAAAGLSSAGAASAADDTLNFVHALLDKGYADVAIDYLNDLKKSNALSGDASVTFDFEMSRCLRTAAKQAYSPEIAAEQMKEAKECIDRFLKEQPNHPKAIEAVVWWASFATDEAMKHLEAAREPKLAKDKKDAELALARAALEDARPRLLQAAEKFKNQMGSARGKKVREELDAKWQSTLFQAILCNYYLAQTYADPKDPKRLQVLDKTQREFDDIFQHNRTSDMGLLAHYWQGKTAMEQGDLDLAKDIFDEVLAPFEIGTPEPLGREAASLYTQAKQLRLEITAQESIKTFVTEARTWREQFRKTLQKTEGYQGISLALAKTLLAQADRTVGGEKGKLQAEAEKIIDEMTRVPGSYQAAARAMYRAKVGAGGEPTNSDDAAALGDEALRAKQYDKAIGYYKQARQFISNKVVPASQAEKKTAQISLVNDAIGQAIYLTAHDQFNKGDLAGCLKTVDTLTSEYHQSAAAPIGAVLRVTVKLNQYMAIPDGRRAEKARALQEVIDSAMATTKAWPGLPEADDARMILGQAYLVNREIDKALKQFDMVNHRSERYPTAQYLLGQTIWYHYYKNAENQKPGGHRDQAALAAARQQAVEAVTNSVNLQHRMLAASAPMPRPLLEAQLLLAEMQAEGGDAKAAAVLFQPLIKAAKDAPQGTIDAGTMLRIFLGGVRAYVACNDLDKAGTAAMVLIDLGPDNDYVNHALVGFGKLLDVERKKAEAAVIAAVLPAEVGAAKTRLAGMNEILGKLLTKLAAREKLVAADMVWMAETSSAVGLDEAAEKQCQRFLTRLKDDPAFASGGAAKAEPRVRSLLIHILGKRGKYEEAVKQAATLIQAQPRALEPRVEECRLRHAWAIQNPEQFIPAQRACETLRSSLDRIKTKKPPEYYEVVFYEADCLRMEAENLVKKGNKAQAAESAKKGEELLKFCLFNKPELDGPDRVEMYKKLLGQFALLQGHAPPAQKPGP